MFDMDAWLEEREARKGEVYASMEREMAALFPPTAGAPLPGIPCSSNGADTVTIDADPAPAPVDNVNHPPHYTRTTLETLDVIEDMVQGWDPKVAYLLGNVVKYVWRHADKAPVESLKKARFYLDRAINYLEPEKRPWSS